MSYEVSAGEECLADPVERYTQTSQDLRDVAIVAYDPDQDVLGADLFVPTCLASARALPSTRRAAGSEGASTGGLWDA